jgi:hypothetical protein
VQDKRLTGEEFDQKLFRSLARIGSSMRGVGMPKIPSAGRRGVGGRVKPSRATRADWPSEAEIADMVDRNRDGFVGDGEPWMTRVRRRARNISRSRNSEPTSIYGPVQADRNESSGLTRNLPSKKRRTPKKKPSSRDENNISNVETGRPKPSPEILAEIGAMMAQWDREAEEQRKLHPEYDDPTFTQDDLDFAKSVINLIKTKDPMEDMNDENIVIFTLDLLQEAKRNGHPTYSLMSDAQLQDKDLALQIIKDGGGLSHVRNELGSILEGVETDTSETANEIVQTALAMTISETPIIRSLIEKYGWPKSTGMFTSLATGSIDTSDTAASIETQTVQTQGFFSAAWESVFFSRPLFGWWINKESLDPEVESPAVDDLLKRPDAPASEIITGTPMGTIRHEYGHFLDALITYTGKDSQVQAIADLKSYFENELPALQQKKEDLAQKLEDRYIELGGNPLNRDAKIMQQVAKEFREERLEAKLATYWMSRYAMTEDYEFMAELFAAATSANEKLRKVIPPNLITLVEQWLDIELPK